MLSSEFSALHGRIFRYTETTMNIRTTLMLMAATVAGPVSAQQPAEVYTALAAPATATATAAQRAEAMPALAIMPADCELCFTFTDIPAFIEKLHAVGAIDDEDYAELPDEIKAINSFALAGGKGMSATFSTIMGLYNCYSAGDMMPALKQIVAEAAPQYKETLKAEVENAIAANTQDFKNLLAQGKIAPAYAVLVANPGYESMLAEWYEALISEIEAEVSMEDGFEYTTINGYSGLKVQLPEEESQPSPWADEFETAFVQEAVKRTLYVLFKLEGDKIIAVVCEDPTQINTAATAEESILGTDKLAKADSKLNQGLQMAFYASAEATNPYSTENGQDFIKLGKTAQAMFTALAGKADANQATFAAAAKSMGTLINAWTGLTNHTATQPTTASISWNDADIDIDIYSDNMGYTAKPAKLSLLSKAADPNTILYTESAYTTGCPLPELATLIDAGVEIAEGVIALAPEDEQASAAMQMAMVKGFLPEAKEAVNALSTVVSGLDNTYGIVIDNAATMPVLLGGKPGNTTEFPRVAFYSGVSNRAKLSEGWDALLAVAGKVAEKVGYPSTTVNMLPIAPKMLGNATSYSIALPWFSEDLVPNLTVTDTAFVVGSSSTLNAELATAATGTLEFPGAVCSIKFAPLATMLRSLADDMADRAEAEAAAAPEKQPATEPVVVIEDDEDDAEFDEEADYVDEDDFDEEEIYAYHYREESPAERRAEKFENAADVAEAAAEHVESFNAIYTMEGTDARMRIQVKLKK